MERFSSVSFARVTKAPSSESPTSAAELTDGRQQLISAVRPRLVPCSCPHG